MRLNEIRVVVRGGGDLASGVIYRLKRAGLQVIVTETHQPLVVRRTVSFAEAIFAGQIALEGFKGIWFQNKDEAIDHADEPEVIPVIADPNAEIIKKWEPHVVVDAIMAKANIGNTQITDAPLVIALGPGFTAGVDVHAVIETKRGHFLGRVLYSGQAIPNTGIPGLVEGIGIQRVVYSNTSGVFTSERQIGDWIHEGEIFGYIDNEPVKAEITGCIRGLLKSGIKVLKRVKVGDIDPRKNASFTAISDKALAIGGGVMEAIFSIVHAEVEIMGV